MRAPATAYPGRWTPRSAAAVAVLVTLWAGGLPAQSLDAERLDEWLAAYETAWETKDAAAAARLFTADARYYETPHADPFAGRDAIRDYWSRVTADQREIEFESEIVAIADETGVARWNATFVVGPDATPVALDGVFVLRFDDDGLVDELREWWHARP